MADRTPLPLPEHVDVGPLRYTITDDETTRLRQEVEGRERLLGHCDNGKLIIVVDPDTPASLQREVIVHELLHAIFNLTGLGHDLEEADKGEEERHIQRLSPPILDLLRRNPALVSYLTAP